MSPAFLLLPQPVEKGLAGETHEHGHILVPGEYDHGGKIGRADFMGPLEAGLHGGNGGLGFFAQELDGPRGMGDHNQVLVFEFLDQYGQCGSNLAFESQGIGRFDPDGRRGIL